MPWDPEEQKYTLPYNMDEHKARLMCSDPIACSYEWINGYIANLNSQISDDNDEDYNHSLIDFDELIQVAMSNVDGGRWGGDYITKGGVFEGRGTDPTFWDKLSILLEKEIPDDRRNNFFSCSC